MKKNWIFLLIGVLCVSNGFAQGSVVFSDIPGGIGARVYTNTFYGTNGATLAPAGFYVQLMYGPVGTSYGQLTPGVTIQSELGNGLFFLGQIQHLSGIPAGLGSSDPILNVALAVRGWLGPYTNYDEAVFAGGIVGHTEVFGNPTGAGGTPPSQPANLVGWLAGNSLVLAPEPGTIALGGLGLAAVLLFRRRK